MVPLERAMLNAVIESLPSPEDSQKAKVNKLSEDFNRNTPKFLELKRHIATCSQNEPIIVFVTKM